MITKHSEFADEPVHRLFERRAGANPEMLAVVCGEQRLSYRELNERANQVARYLCRQGVAPEELIGVAMGRSPLMIAALLGVWKAGCAYVPLDPGYPSERLGFMVRDAGLRIVLADDKSAPRLLRDFQDERAVRLLVLNPECSAWREQDENLHAQDRKGSLAYVMYTSGSTGQPKGAMITHAGLANYLNWAVDAYRLQPGGSVPVHSSLSFDLTVTSMHAPLLAGAHIELLSEDVPAHDSLVAALRDKRRSLVKITPAHLELLNHELRPEEMAGIADVFVIGGEALPAERLAAWRAHAPGTRLINEYGPTETVVGCCVHEVSSADSANGPVPIGRPIANMKLHVLDEQLHPVAAGEIGELYIGGPGVARGYLNRPQLTEERFVPDPFSDRPDARLYRSGDLARYRAEGDGVLEYLGRRDDQVKVRGHRVELGEVEHALAAHPQVKICAALAHQGANGDTELLAFAVVHCNADASIESLESFLRQRLPSFMVPRRLIRLDAMPLNLNGKIDRPALRTMATVSVPESCDAHLPPSRKPRTATEEMVMAAFREAFQRHDIGLFDDFFDMGGHSMMAVRLMAALRAATGINLPLRSLYEHPTVAGLGDAIDAMRWSSEAPDSLPSHAGEDIEGRTLLTI